MRVETIVTREAVHAIAPEWDALAQTEPRDGFFRTSGWYLAWMKHIRPDAEPFVLVVRDSAGKLAGLAPLCRAPYQDLGFHLDAIRWAGRETVSGDFLDFVCASESRGEAVRRMLDTLWEHRYRWGVLVMGELIKGGPTEAALEKLAAREGLPLRKQEERVCPYIELPETFDAYLESLSSSTRYHIRRRMRDFEKKGARVDVFTRPAEMDTPLDTLIELHLSRWERDNQPGTFGRPGFAAFMHSICTSPPAGSSCRLYQLSHEEKPVASLLTFRFGQSTLYYQVGWDPNHPLASQSPGVVVMAHSIRDAIQERSRYYEFLRGDEAYKSRWTKTQRQTVTLLLPRGIMARGYHQVAGMKDKIKARLNRPKSISTEIREEADAVTASTTPPGTAPVGE